jgi:hypothetical protein
MRRVPAYIRTFVARGQNRRSRLAPRLALLGLAALTPLAGCTSAQMSGQASSYLIVQNIQGASGAKPDEIGIPVSSDVLTLVKKQVGGQEVLVPTIFEDIGTVTFRLGMKDPGLTPSSTNYITVTRYKVDFVRTDGRNTPGVDVPYGFHGGMTTTVTDDVITSGFGLVRIQSKQEAPLKPLIGGGGAIAISTIAEVTFYGTDQAGREVSASGRISVNFADWGDPD